MLSLLPPRRRCECIGTGVSAQWARAMIVFATRARQSDVLPMRSSCRKRSSGGSPFAEHDARNFITSKVRSLLSSRGSIRAIDSGRSLCHEPTNEFIEQTLVTRSSIRAVTNGHGNHSQAQDIDIPQRFCEQSSLSLFALPLPYYPVKQAVIPQFVKAPLLSHTRSNRTRERMRHPTCSDSRIPRLTP